MAEVCIDSVVLIDYKAEDGGDRHDHAQRIVRAIDSGEYPTAHVTNYVLLETLNLLHERMRHGIAVDLRQRLHNSAGFRIFQAPQRDYHRAVELFEAYERPAFGDCTIAAYMEREDLEFLYTFDADDFGPFDWVTSIGTPVNPFEPD